jgi:hypothetical protein
LIGDGKGGFTPTVNRPIGNYPRALGLSTIQQNHKPELVVAISGSNSVAVVSDICH